ncbi:hypothetical protein [Citrobacter sp. RHB25-C09]|uniref:hypothetical protein n=1 Tax=Citrobacter sp. RHB25-C09 TaxID=2742624 RepID=UPI0015EE7144|nr:hypothetical protein [Citrobacter sp. RHB25-C09]QMI06423.1 hypothetical protein HVY19_16855 [Citrobacter sp. RHB25-C09]
MDIYDSSFVFEGIYFIISLFFCFAIIYRRAAFNSEKSRDVLFFSVIPLKLTHLFIWRYGISGLFKLLGSKTLFMFDETFIKTMAMAFFFITCFLTFNMYWRIHRRFRN